ncbi:MAG: diacylglycerol kinase family protein [Eubacteriales bacterium]
MENYKKSVGWIRSFKNAFDGVLFTYKTQNHLRFHLFAALVVVLCGLLFNITKSEWLIIVYAIGSVIIAEIFNTAIEQVVDLISPEYNSLAGKAKDIAAGAVLIAALQAVIIGVIVFGSYI